MEQVIIRSFILNLILAVDSILSTILFWELLKIGEYILILSAETCDLDTISNLGAIIINITVLQTLLFATTILK